MNTNETSQKPPGYWFGVIEHGLREKMRDAFTDLDLSRGEWRILHTIADEPKSVDEIESALPPGERHRRKGAGFGRFGRGFGPGYWPGNGAGFWPGYRAGNWPTYGPGFGRGFAPGFGHAFARGPESDAAPSPDAHAEHAGQNAHPEHHAHEHDAHGHHPGHHGHPDHHDDAYPGHHAHHGHGAEHGDRRQRRGPRSVAEVLVSFTERGWVVLADGVATLTDAGRTAHDEAQSRVADVRASVTEGISEADYQTTMASLEKMARNVGWGEPEQDDPAQGDES